MRRHLVAAISLSAGGLGTPAALAQQESFPITENFDSYPVGVFPCVGAACAGPNGWSIWYLGGTPGAIVSGNAHSGANAFQITAGSDVVQTGNVTSGEWTLRAYTFVPAAATGTGYFIVMHAYNGVPAAPDRWAIQIQFNATTNSVVNFNNSAVLAPLIRDQWVELRAEVNLTSNTYDVFYGGNQVITGLTYATAGTPGIACLDLYGETTTGMLFDTVSVQPAGPAACYANCDNSTQAPVLNVADFGCFLTRYAAGEAYANCDESTQPPVLNVADFGCFLTKYAAGCP
ncbi:MAG: hypothetical protein WD749_13935 [Phycisphaerales bacterium]